VQQNKRGEKTVSARSEGGGAVHEEEDERVGEGRNDLTSLEKEGKKDVIKEKRGISVWETELLKSKKKPRQKFPGRAALLHEYNGKREEGDV